MVWGQMKCCLRLSISYLNALQSYWPTSTFLNYRSSSFLVVNFRVTWVVLLSPQGPSDERFQQQEDRMQQLRQDLRRVQNLCSSAERELRYEREKNVDLQKQNFLLQQECSKVGTEQGERHVVLQAVGGVMC